MPRSPDCMLRIESLSWHSGTPMTTIGGAIQSGELPATKRPRRVKAADFEAWLERQAMDGGKRYKRRDELARWRQRYPEGEAAPLESYPVAEAPAPAPQLELVAEVSVAEPDPTLDYRDMLLRTMAAIWLGGDYADLPVDVTGWWEQGACYEGNVRHCEEQLKQAERMRRNRTKPRHGALTDAEIASLEAA